MQQKRFCTPLAVAALVRWRTGLAVLALLALVSCASGPDATSPTARPPTAVTASVSTAPQPIASPNAQTNPAVQPTQTAAAPSNSTIPQQTPSSNAQDNPAAQATEPGAPGETGKPGAEGNVSPEGGPSLPSITNPGGLPPSPQSNDPSLDQMGEEKMVVYREPQGRYQVLFVNGWTSGAGDAPGSIKSAFKDRSAQVAVVNGSGQAALAFATADEAQVKTAAPGYQRLALKAGQIPYGAVASLIYRFQAGQNPVTGKALNFIAARVYVPRQGTNDLAIITVVGPAPFYGDLSELFDRIVTSFRWL